jgi:uncharacterized protein (DUF983 family)
MPQSEHDHHVSPWSAGLRSRCPRCGEGHLFTGFLKVGKSCESCGLDYDFADSGDGPAVFIIFIAGAAVVLLWAIVDALFHPPVIVHLALWIPTTIVLCLAMLRPFKAVMIALQYANSAREGRSE